MSPANRTPRYGDALGGHRDDRPVEHRPDRGLGRRVDGGHGCVRAHTAGVRTGVAVAGPLVVAAERQRHHPLAVAEREGGHLRAFEQLLHHDDRAGGAEGPLHEAAPDRGDRIVAVRCHHHALAGREAVGLHHGTSAELVDERARLLDVVEAPGAGRGDAAALQEFLREGLRSLETRCRGGRPEDDDAARVQRVGQPADQRELGADDDEIRAQMVNQTDHLRDVVDRGRMALGQLRDAGVPGSRQQARHGGILREPPHERVLATAAADDEDLHDVTGTLCSRAGPTPIIDTGTPPSSSRKRTYPCASFGRSSNTCASPSSSSQPGSSSQTGSA